jgi:hypothetical protein
MRKRKTTIAILAALTLATMKLVAQNVEAAPKGSKAEAHMSEKRRANPNAQWSADPEKGWVRAEERQQLGGDKKEHSKRNQINRKGNSSKKNSERSLERKIL